MQVSVNIATLQGIVVTKEVYMVIIPASDGEVGIMAEHAAFIFKLNGGLVKLYDSETHAKEKIFIFGGFAQVYKDKIDIVTDKAMKLEDLDIKYALEQIVALENKLLSSEDEENINSIQKELGLYRKMLEVTQS